MGYNSDRPLTDSERLGSYAKEISATRDTASFNWQTTTGAKIRGDMGIEKGNAFIKAINQAKSGRY